MKDSVHGIFGRDHSVHAVIDTIDPDVVRLRTIKFGDPFGSPVEAAFVGAGK